MDENTPKMSREGRRTQRIDDMAVLWRHAIWARLSKVSFGLDIVAKSRCSLLMCSGCFVQTLSPALASKNDFDDGDLGCTTTCASAAR